jgi:hypothetical protein
MDESLGFEARLKEFSEIYLKYANLDAKGLPKDQAVDEMVEIRNKHFLNYGLQINRLDHGVLLGLALKDGRKRFYASLEEDNPLKSSYRPDFHSPDCSLGINFVINKEPMIEFTSSESMITPQIVKERTLWGTRYKCASSYGEMEILPPPVDCNTYVPFKFYRKNEEGEVTDTSRSIEGFMVPWEENAILSFKMPIEYLGTGLLESFFSHCDYDMSYNFPDKINNE